MVELVRREPLSPEECRHFDKLIAARVGMEAFKPRRGKQAAEAVDAPDNEPQEPELRPRRFFPSVGTAKGGVDANRFWAAIKDLRLTNIRLVTLRFGSEKPTSGGLLDAIKALSAASDKFVAYLAPPCQ
jgi:hypothetical protein